MMTYRALRRIRPEDMERKIGHILGPEDVSIMVTETSTILKPDGSPLLVYVRGGIPEELREIAYPILTKIRVASHNRGQASGGDHVRKWNTNVSPKVLSSLIGATDPMAGGRFPYCRLTAWTAENLKAWEELRPVWVHCAELFRKYVPDRYQVQKDFAYRTDQDWIVEGTPYSTVTVNNTYPTGVHKDAGDLQEGFSNLFVLRRGDYTGGALVFPEFRVGVDLQDGDFVMMDAHEFHGNTQIYDSKGEPIYEPGSAGEERISCVLYYRAKMVECGTVAEEEAKKEKGKK